jgi:predicted nucleic acid-binding protein
VTADGGEDGDGGPGQFVFDTSALYHAALAERLDVLGYLVRGATCVTTRVVLDELRRGAAARPRLLDAERQDWLTEARVDGLEEIRRVIDWARRLEVGARDHGEATVIAYAEMHRAVAIVDDRRAWRLAERAGVPVHGTLWLVARACRNGRVTEAGAGGLIDALADAGARLPCDGAGFRGWAIGRGLLPDVTELTRHRQAVGG